MKTLNLVTAWHKKYVTIRYSASKKLIWNEWRGFIPSKPLREAMIYSCEFIVANDVELILADFTRFGSPTMDDQVWIANHSAAILKDSHLKRVANIMAQDIFQQMAVEAIYAVASKVPMPCITKDFVNQDDALYWLLAD